GDPYRRTRAEDGDEAARDELLGPEDDRPGTTEVEESDDYCDHDRSSAAGEWLAQRDSDEGEKHRHRERPGEREHKGRNVTHSHLDRRPGRSPDERDAHVCGDHSKRRHAPR